MFMVYDHYRATITVRKLSTPMHHNLTQRESKIKNKNKTKTKK